MKASAGVRSSSGRRTRAHVLHIQLRIEVMALKYPCGHVFVCVCERYAYVSYVCEYVIVMRVYLMCVGFNSVVHMYMIDVCECNKRNNSTHRLYEAHACT